jgi:hypothetical protein
MGRSAVLAIAAILGAAACTDSSRSPAGPTAAATVTPTEYLGELLRLMEAEAANARRIDWALARTQVMAAAGAAQSIPDTYPAIAVALNILDDFESNYRGSDGRLIGPSPESVCLPGVTVTPRLPDTIGYVRLGGCNCGGVAAGFDTRSFGAPTCGHHHLLSDFRMSDGATLTLKNAHNADRMKRTYAGRVVPDEVVTAPGEAVTRAVNWLLNQG